MRFETYGPFEIPRLPSGLIARKGAQRSAFWDEVDSACEGLPDGCGCYAFALRNRGLKPWYVGKAERQTFSAEVFQPGKLNHYDEVVSSHRGTPVMFFLAKTTAGGRLSRTTVREYPSVDFLEDALIAMALARNEELCNVSGTRILRNLSVPGILTPVPGRRSEPVRRLRESLGLTD